jgi:hypothetical protein
MRSFTSSSDFFFAKLVAAWRPHWSCRWRLAPRVDRRVLVTLVLLVVGVEVLTRTCLFRVSKDFRRFSTYSGRASALSAAPGFDVALIGNSATQRGVDPAVFPRAAGRAAGHRVAADFFLADGSQVNTWYYMLQRYFWQPRHSPDLVVVNFFSDGLEDSTPEEIGRLAQFFTTPEDWGEVLGTDLPELGQRAEFLLSSVCASYAARERIKERVLSALVPGYEEYIYAINEINFERGAAGKPRTPTYRALERLLRRAREQGTRLCFVAFPTRPCVSGAPYAIPQEVSRCIRDAGMDLVDLRTGEGLSLDHYADDVHLNEAGQAIYTRSLARAVRPVVRAALRDRHLIAASHGALSTTAVSPGAALPLVGNTPSQ